jgi:hypothetical protein
MLVRKEYIDQITDALSILAHKVEISTKLNLTDINIAGEDFYKDLLNLSLGYKLQNINEINPNAAAIDLGCTVNRIAIQVTSTSALKKTRETVEKFIGKEFHKEYDRLIIFNLVKVTKHNDTHVGEKGVYQLNTSDDMWDYTDFARMIVGKDLELLKSVVEFLQEQLKISPPEPIPKEVKTVVALIDHLSNCENEESGSSFIEKPDPKGKIYERFSDHSDFLTEMYGKLFVIYGANLETVKDLADIGVLQIQKKSLYLQMYSDKVLSECSGDPKVALDKLTNTFTEVINGKGIDVDITAITFYLVNELIRCNVFPNIKSDV